MALASDDGVRLTGIGRDDSQTPSKLSSQATKVSERGDVTMMTFYNDLNLVYATSALPTDAVGKEGDRGSAQVAQQAFRQITPGPDTQQRLPDSTVVALASGQIALYRRLAVLDDLGIVRSVSGSLDGSWSIADSQVTALGAQ
ncbi:hypothetical protein EMB92_07395 [Bifidobacterium callitrichos]|uniref:Uncharacterized protein n=1 Tax=Bifidobacterium callitrichos TaxID=762209 RepID=A0A5M9ZBQ5_9BIFI|nr:hypothetical protein EMB92_07395 [Bifidobacterium callitrichos]